ncbi:ABC transporter permease subunit [Bacillus sp. PS06]|uniref:ABC transporter permease subunit n=1 Tax=Bacillus sp. PS06 TaxID=2764176 RepID=UPI00177D2B28|nr:ABC transporter permease subunit [Bacillus sp. PS06]MBD8069049.1 ABC transporter permease subunit [Bacillus sp. PS06]
MLARFIVRTLVIYVVSALLIVLIVFFPKDAMFFQEPGKLLPTFYASWETYIPETTTFMKQVMTEGYFGVTRSHTLVTDEVVRVFPRTMKIIITSFFLIIVLGVLKGVFDYRNQYRLTNLFGNRLTSLAQSFPDFFFIIALIWILLFYFPFIDVFAYEEWYGFILPSLIVTVYPMTYVAKITMNALLDEQSEQYVQVSYAKGFKKRFVVTNHMLHNSLGNVFSHLPSIMLLLLSNLLVLEMFLDYKGAAYRLFMAIPHERELIVALAWLFMTIVFITQIVSYLLRYYFDPRERSAT